RDHGGGTSGRRHGAGRPAAGDAGGREMTEQNGTQERENAGDNLRRRRALIVDDEAGVRESLRMVLKDGYDLVVAASGAEALDVVGKSSPDVVLLDIVMPGMDGMQVLEE